jgi:hypothetical protein
MCGSARRKTRTELLGRPAPRLNRWELQQQHAAAAEAEVTPATVSQVDSLAQKVQQLANKVGLMGRRPRAEALDSWRVDVELRGGHPHRLGTALGAPQPRVVGGRGGHRAALSGPYARQPSPST